MKRPASSSCIQRSEMDLLDILCLRTFDLSFPKLVFYY